jgi:hypothetical protein
MLTRKFIKYKVRYRILKPISLAKTKELIILPNSTFITRDISPTLLPLSSHYYKF